MREDSLPSAYTLWMASLKKQIEHARRRAAQSLNTTLIEVYWEIGKQIMIKEKGSEWGSGFIERLSRDLISSFPDMKGFSRRNLYAIRQWYSFYSARHPIVPQAVAQTPWGHNRLILDKITDLDEALWYAAAVAAHGWTRETLEEKFRKGEYLRAGKSLSNFTDTLPAAQSALARETLKDPYNFDFIGLGDEAQEKANWDKRICFDPGDPGKPAIQTAYDRRTGIRIGFKVIGY